MSRKDQVNVSRREYYLETVVYSAEQEVTVPASITIPEGTQFLLQPVLILPKDRITIVQGPGKIRVQGEMEGIVSCVGSGEEVSTLPVPALEFMAAFSAPVLDPKVRLEADMHFDGVEVDLSEGNVANITAYIVISLRALQTQGVEIVNAVKGGDLLAETNSVRVQSIMEEIASQQNISMQFALPPETAPAATELCIGNLSWQVEEGSLTAEGIVLAKVYCLSGEGKLALLTGNREFRLEMDFAAPEVRDSSLDCIFDRVSLKTIDEGAALELNLVLQARGKGYSQQVAEYVSSVDRADSQQKRILLRNRIGESEFKLILEGNCPLVSTPPDAELVLPRVRITETQALEGKILLRGLIALNIFYTDENNTPRVLVQEEEFTQFFDLPGSLRGYGVKCWVWPEGASCSQGRYSVPVLVRVEVFEDVEFTAVTDVHVVDPSHIPAAASVILYTVQKGDNLFALARRFNTTQELLRGYNNLEGDEGLVPGDKLIIPVYQIKN